MKTLSKLLIATTLISSFSFASRLSGSGVNPLVKNNLSTEAIAVKKFKKLMNGKYVKANDKVFNEMVSRISTMNK